MHHRPKKNTILFLFAILLALSILKLDVFADFAKITGSIVNVRSGPGLDYEIVQKINRDQQYTILEQQDGWIKIDLGNQKTGWVADWLIEIKVNPAEQIGKQLKSKVKVLNVRQEPNTSSAILDKISPQSTFLILDIKDDWYQIQLSDEKKGWVAGEFTEVITDQTSIAPQQAKVKILTNGTNLRSGPSIKHSSIAKALAGEEYKILEKVEDWFKIELKDGSFAYVASWVVSAIGISADQDQIGSGTLKGKTFVVDAGHGGKDQGSEGISKKTIEKDLNLIIASILSNKLKQAGAKVYQTRTDDQFISLQDRVNLSVNHQADAFISVHLNTYKTSSMNGTITFYYSEKRDKNLANSIQAELVKEIGLKDLGTRYGDYFVLRESSRVSVLVELGFLSNRKEEKTINTKEFQENAAEGIYRGVVKYFGSLKKN